MASFTVCTTRANWPDLSSSECLWNLKVGCWKRASQNTLNYSFVPWEVILFTPQSVSHKIKLMHLTLEMCDFFFCSGCQHWLYRINCDLPPPPRGASKPQIQPLMELMYVRVPHHAPCQTVYGLYSRVKQPVSQTDRSHVHARQLQWICNRKPCASSAADGRLQWQLRRF